jgi:hypothetical protein
MFASSQVCSSAAHATSDAGSETLLVLEPVCAAARSRISWPSFVVDSRTCVSNATRFGLGEAWTGSASAAVRSGRTWERGGARGDDGGERDERDDRREATGEHRPVSHWRGHAGDHAPTEDTAGRRFGFSPRQACLIVIRSMMFATSSALSIVASSRP